MRYLVQRFKCLFKLTFMKDTYTIELLSHFYPLELYRHPSDYSDKDAIKRMKKNSIKDVLNIHTSKKYTIGIVNRVLFLDENSNKGVIYQVIYKTKKKSNG